jgi:hypothetical protein
MGAVIPQFMADNGAFDHCLKDMLVSLRSMDDSSEKEECYRGLVQMGMVRPQTMMNHFVDFCKSIASYRLPFQISNASFRVCTLVPAEFQRARQR